MKQQKDHIGDVNKMLTAVEWLVKELNLEGYDYTISQAKAMEKEQIINAYKNGMYVPSELDEYGSYKSAEQYYNETFGK